MRRRTLSIMLGIPGLKIDLHAAGVYPVTTKHMPFAQRNHVSRPRHFLFNKLGHVCNKHFYGFMLRVDKGEEREGTEQEGGI